MSKEGFIQTSDEVPTEDQCWGSNVGGGAKPVYVDPSLSETADRIE